MMTDEQRAAIRTLRALTDRARWLEREKAAVAAERGAAVRAALDAGLTAARIARLLGVDRSRVRQLKTVGM